MGRWDNETVGQWDSGTAGQRDSGTVGQWDYGIVGQRDNATMGKWDDEKKSLIVPRSQGLIVKKNRAEWKVSIQPYN